MGPNHGHSAHCVCTCEAAGLLRPRRSGVFLRPPAPVHHRRLRTPASTKTFSFTHFGDSRGLRHPYRESRGFKTKFWTQDVKALVPVKSKDTPPWRKPTCLGCGMPAFQAGGEGWASRQESAQTRGQRCRWTQGPARPR